MPRSGPAAGRWTRNGRSVAGRPFLWPALAAATMLTAAAPAPDERHVMISAVERMRVSGRFDVEVRGGAPGVTLIGPRNALLTLYVRGEGGTLTIGNGNRRVSEGERIRVIVSTPALRSISSSGGANVSVARLRAPRIDLSLQDKGSLTIGELRTDDLHVTHLGSGAITLAGTAVKLRASGSGDAAIVAAKLLANDAVLLWQGNGDLSVGVRYTAQVSNNGKGQVTVLGNPECKPRGPGPIACGAPKPR